MIKLSTATHNQGRIVRETSAPFVIYSTSGEKTEQITVRYYSLSVKESKEFRKSIDEKGDVYLSDILAPIIESLPDVVDDKEKPVKITVDVLERFNAVNLRAIQKAIEADLLGK